MPTDDAAANDAADDDDDECDAAADGNDASDDDDARRGSCRRRRIRGSSRDARLLAAPEAGATAVLEPPSPVWQLTLHDDRSRWQPVRATSATSAVRNAAADMMAAGWRAIKAAIKAAISAIKAAVRTSTGAIY